MFLPRFLYCTFCFAILLCSTSAFAQKQFGTAQGTAYDAEGQPIPGASVVASSELWGSTNLNTDVSGRYRIESLIPGTYALEARLVGFQSVLKTDVRISAGSVSIVDFVLEPEKFAESVTVESATPQIDSTTTAFSYTIPLEIIQGLPAQDFRSLLALTPGFGDDGVAYGGSPRTDNRIWIDGVDVSNTANGGIFFTTQSGFDRLLFDGASAGILIKLRPNGTVAWQKSLDFSSYLSWFSSVIAMPDGGVIAVGAIARNRVAGPDLESLVVSFAATGEIVWAKNFKLLAHTSQVPSRIPESDAVVLITSTATSNNGFIVAFQKRDIRNRPLDGVDVMKITNSGNVVWEKSLKTGPAFVFQSAGKTAAGGVILIGNGPNSNKLKVVVLRANGTLSWTAGYSLKVPGNITSLSSPVQTLDGGYVVTGGAGTYGFIAKIDSSRKIGFQNTIGNSNANGPDVGASVFAAVDGGFVVFGQGGSRSLKDNFVLKVNSEGIVPSCGLLQTQQFGPTTRASFGPLRIRGLNTTAGNDLSFEPLDFGLSSFVTNHHVSTLCR